MAENTEEYIDEALKNKDYKNLLATIELRKSSRKEREDKDYYALVLSYTIVWLMWFYIIKYWLL